MNNELFKLIANAMNTIEKDANGKVYLLNPDVEAKAYSLYSSFISDGINAKIDYSPAYLQIIVTAECAVLDIRNTTYKNDLLDADIIGIDITSDDLLHIECVFNNAFRKAGVLNEQ